VDGAVRKKECTSEIGRNGIGGKNTRLKGHGGGGGEIRQREGRERFIPLCAQRVGGGGQKNELHQKINEKEKRAGETV